MADSANGEWTCSLCGKRHVKLWWPEELERSFFICANCAEKMQSPCFRFKKIGTDAHGADIFAKKATRMNPVWKVDENGTIPLYKNGEYTGERTNHLIVDLSKYFSDSVFSGEITVVPAVRIPGMDATLKSAFPYKKEEWLKLPTR